MFVPNAYKAVGGNILAHASHTRLEIKGANKKDGKRVVKVIKSAKLAQAQCVRIKTCC
jgi:RecA/RadA recombinase